MATIRKRIASDGKPRYQVLVRRQGKAITKTFLRKRDADSWGAQTESDIQSGRFRAGPETKTLRQAMHRYWLEVSPTKKGWKQDKSRINVLGRAPFADQPLTEITPEAIGEWRNKRLAKVKPNTVRNDLVLLSSVFEQARLEWRLVHSNPAREIRWPAQSRGRDFRVTPDQEKALLSHGDTVEAALIVVLLETGMRLGEALSLRYPGNLDLEERLVTLADTKNNTQRIVPLTWRAVEALKTVPVDMSSGRLFPWDSSQWGHHFERIRARADLEELTTHDLRHEAVSRLFERGLNVMEVAAISGHKTLAMLQRYTHLKAETLRDRLDQPTIAGAGHA